jgi:hypothetical protein
MRTIKSLGRLCLSTLGFLWVGLYLIIATITIIVVFLLMVKLPSFMVERNTMVLVLKMEALYKNVLHDNLTHEAKEELKEKILGISRRNYLWARSMGLLIIWGNTIIDLCFSGFHWLMAQVTKI